MVVYYIICFLFLLRFFSRFSDDFMGSIKNIFKAIYFNTFFAFTKVYRVLNIRKTSNFVWKELVSFHKKSGWKYGQYEKERKIECRFTTDEINTIEFYYSITNSKLIFNAFILPSFDENKTNDILVLASHFNGLLNFGVVKVNIKYNFVEFYYAGDILKYSIYPGEIDVDTSSHFNIVKDCYWSFNELLVTGEDPVFIFSELLRRREEKK